MIFIVIKSVKGVEQGLRGDTVTVRSTEPLAISDGEGVYIGSSIALLLKVPGDPEEVQLIELLFKTVASIWNESVLHITPPTPTEATISGTIVKITSSWTNVVEQPPFIFCAVNLNVTPPVLISFWPIV